jgi:anaerobic selenocysteine-containing dehydrogenase
VAVRADEVVLTTCPRDCYDACGITVLKHDGAIRHVRGDPNHPVARGKPCRKCSIGYNGAFLEPEARLTQPLRRVGAKGDGEFEPVSWDEALGEIAERLHRVEAAAGAHTVLNAHYTGTFSLLAYFFPLRFFNRMGATEVDPDTICNKAGHVALEYVYGTSMVGFDPLTARDSACILVWGANPSASAPHAHDHWLPESPARVIVVDPVRTPTAEAADLHLQPFPGSDAALAFAFLHVLAREELVDTGFVGAHTVGWEELEPLLADCTPEWGETVTGVPAALIEEAATLYGRGPSLLWLGQGFQRQRNGGNVVRACAFLPRSPAISARRAPASSTSTGPTRGGSTRTTWPGRTSGRTRPRRSATWSSSTAWRIPPGRRRSSAGTSTLPPPTRSRAGCMRRCAARTSSPSRSTCSRRTRPTSPTTSFLPRASSSSTISSLPTST